MGGSLQRGCVRTGEAGGTLRHTIALKLCLMRTQPGTNTRAKAFPGCFGRMHHKQTDRRPNREEPPLVPRMQSPARVPRAVPYSWCGSFACAHTTMRWTTRKKERASVTLVAVPANESKFHQKQERAQENEIFKTRDTHRALGREPDEHRPYAAKGRMSGQAQSLLLLLLLEKRPPPAQGGPGATKQAGDRAQPEGV